MKQVNLRLAALLWLLVCAQHSFSQLLLVKDKNLQATLEKVLAALPGQLKPITGSLVADNPQSREYESKVVFPGGISSSVVQYASVDNKKLVTAWQAVAFEAEAFAAASKKFKWLYNQIKGTSFRCGGRHVKLQAKYETPDESLSFTTIQFEQPDTGGLERITLTMQYEVTNWVVRLAVYNEDKEVAALLKKGPPADSDY